jgi:hypothetical protein
VTVFCKAKVRVPSRQEDSWSFCDLPPKHEGPHSFHLEGDRSNKVISRLLESAKEYEARLDAVRKASGQSPNDSAPEAASVERMRNLLDQARSMLRGNPKAAKLVKLMNEVLP